MADIRGTSPKVWNAWKGKLLEDLYRLTLAALGGAHADAHTVLAERKEEAARLTRRAGLRDDAREAFWNQLDVAYFLRHDASDIAWHTRHLYHQVTPAEPVVRARPTEQGEACRSWSTRATCPICSWPSAPISPPSRCRSRTPASIPPATAGRWTASSCCCPRATPTCAPRRHWSNTNWPSA